MTSLTKLLTTTALATALTLNSYSQKMLCDTLYADKNEIESVVCRKEDYGGTRTIYISDFKDGKVFFRKELLYSKTDKLLSYKKFEKDAEGNILIKLDFTGDGHPDEVWKWSDKEKVAFIDNNNDGFFETLSTDKYFSHEKGGLFPEPDETYKITSAAPDTSIKRTKLAGDLENVILAFVDIYENEDKLAFNIDLDEYNLLYETKKFSALGLLMGTREEGGLDFAPPLRIYIIKRKVTKKDGKEEKIEDKKISVIPAIINGGYDFSKDSPKKIKKEVEKLLAGMGEKEIYVSEPSKMFSADMFFDLLGKNSKDEKKEKGK